MKYTGPLAWLAGIVCAFCLDDYFSHHIGGGGSLLDARLL